jgi:ribosomal protein S18 acetylase RimI-like enzyme
MAGEVELRIATTAEDFEAGRALFRAYERAVSAPACFAGFERELAELPRRYAPPEGLLVLALVDGAAAGCAGLRRLPDAAAEAKRLWVAPEARGRGAGAALVLRLAEEARRAGFRLLRLETLPDEMAAAIALYRRLGFREIAPYADPPVQGALYMERALG